MAKERMAGYLRHRLREWGTDKISAPDKKG